MSRFENLKILFKCLTRVLERADGLVWSTRLWVLSMSIWRHPDPTPSCTPIRNSNKTRQFQWTVFFFVFFFFSLSIHLFGQSYLVLTEIMVCRSQNGIKLIQWTHEHRLLSSQTNGTLFRTNVSNFYGRLSFRLNWRGQRRNERKAQNTITLIELWWCGSCCYVICFVLLLHVLLLCVLCRSKSVVRIPKKKKSSRNKLSRETPNGNVALYAKKTFSIRFRAKKIVCIAMCAGRTISLYASVYCNLQSFFRSVSRHWTPLWMNYCYYYNEVPFFSLFRFRITVPSSGGFSRTTVQGEIRLFRIRNAICIYEASFYIGYVMADGTNHMVCSPHARTFSIFLFDEIGLCIYNNWMRSMAISYFTVIWSLPQHDSIAANLIFKCHFVLELFIN